MPVTGIDHVQLAMPAGREEEAVAFYEGVLGIPNVPKPEHLAARGGCWFESATVKVHLGVDPQFVAARKAHPALIVDDLTAVTGALTSSGHEVIGDEPLDGRARAYTSDPFGNRIELIEALSLGR